MRIGAGSSSNRASFWASSMRGRGRCPGIWTMIAPNRESPAQAMPRETWLMSLRDDLARVVACDSRYTIHAYFFVFEALEYTKVLKAKVRAKSRPKPRKRVR